MRVHKLRDIYPRRVIPLHYRVGLALRDSLDGSYSVTVFEDYLAIDMLHIHVARKSSISDTRIVGVINVEHTQQSNPTIL